MIVRGKITRVTGGKLYVVVPQLGSTVEYGPLPYLRHRVDGDWTTRPQAGDRVLVSVVEDNPDDLAVLGVIAS